MGLQEAHAILLWHMRQLDAELSEHYDRDKRQLYEALKYAVDKLAKEIASYCNLP